MSITRISLGPLSRSKRSNIMGKFVDVHVPFIPNSKILNSHVDPSSFVYLVEDSVVTSTRENFY